MKEDERRLLDAVLSGASPESIADVTPRWGYILSKWADAGLWNYGVSLRSGWLTSDGVEWAAIVLERGK